MTPVDIHLECRRIKPSPHEYLAYVLVLDPRYSNKSMNTHTHTHTFEVGERRKDGRKLGRYVWKLRAVFSKKN